MLLKFWTCSGNVGLSGLWLCQCKKEMFRVPEGSETRDLQQSV